MQAVANAIIRVVSKSIVASHKTRYEPAVKAYLDKLDPEDKDELEYQIGTSNEYWDLPIVEVLVLIDNGWYQDAHHHGMWNVVDIISPVCLGISMTTGGQKFLVAMSGRPCVMHVKEFLEASNPEARKRMFGCD